MTMNFIIFGPPGAGKGTYSRRLQERLGIPAISTGDIFRDAIASNTELGKKVSAYVERGELVPDEIVNEVLKSRLTEPDCRKGFILDGYPRTVDQAKFLEGITKIDAILNLIVPDEILIEKLSARRICKNCGDIYNIADINKEIGGIHYILPPMLPKQAGKCNKCGGELYQREDDKPEVIKHRLEIYKQQSTPVIEFYKGKVPFVDINVTRGPEIMVNKIVSMLKERNLIE